MTLETVTRIIQFILAPVVMVSTCNILLGNLLTRYGGISGRLRTLAHEHRSLTLTSAPTTAGAAPDAHAVKTALRLHEIDAQIPNLLQRHALMRRSILMIYHATLVFFVDMFVIAIAALESLAGWATVMALLCFLVGIGLAAIGLFLSTQEVRTSHLAVVHDLSWFPGTAGIWGRADSRSQVENTSRPGPFQFNPLTSSSRGIEGSPAALPQLDLDWPKATGA